LVYVGNILDPGDAHGVGRPSHPDDLKLWEKFFNTLGSLQLFSVVVPGYADVPLREFLRLGKDAEVEFEHVHIAHATPIEMGDAVFCGVGGDLTENEDRMDGRLAFSRACAEFYLRNLWLADPPHKVLMLAVAPPGMLGGRGGNRIAGDFVDTYHPSVALVAGPTEFRGTQRIAHTLVINPGRLADGCAALLDWNQPVASQVELLRC